MPCSSACRAFVGVSGHPLVGEVLKRLRPRLPDVDRAPLLLDVGCGDGEITWGLAQLPGVAEVIGLDTDPQVLAEARGKSMAAGLPPEAAASNVRFVEGSALDADFFRRLAGRVRYLTCFTTLHWLKQPPNAQELAVINFARSLELGGQFFLVHFLGLDDSFMELEHGVAQSVLGVGEPLGSTYVPLFTRLPAAQRLAQFRGLFRATGLAIDESRVVEDRFPIAKDQFLKFLEAASAYIGMVPDGLRHEYLTRWHEEMVAKGKVAERRDSYDFSTLALLAALRKGDAAPSMFYDRIADQCEAGVLRLEHLEHFGEDRHADS